MAPREATHAAAARLGLVELVVHCARGGDARLGHIRQGGAGQQAQSLGGGKGSKSEAVSPSDAQASLSARGRTTCEGARPVASGCRRALSSNESCQREPRLALERRTSADSAPNAASTTSGWSQASRAARC